jgi:hypothetical protein
VDSTWTQFELPGPRKTELGFRVACPTRRPGLRTGRHSSTHRTRPAGRHPGNLFLEHAEFCDKEKCEESCVVRRMNEDDGRKKYRIGRADDQPSRFFTALNHAPHAERIAHTTVKSTAFADWLSALSVRSGATVLDLFSGSGSLGLAAARAGAGRVTCVEREEQYVRLIEARLRESA